MILFYTITVSTLCIWLFTLYYQQKSEKEGLLKKMHDEESKRFDSENIFNHLFHKTSEGVLILDGKGRFATCNKAAARILGYEHAELIGKSIFDISPVFQKDHNMSSSEVALDILDTVLIENRQETFEWRAVCKDGHEVLLEIKLFPLDRDDHIELFVLWKDITEYKRMEEQMHLQQAVLIQQSKLAELGNMLGVITHQWKQPVSAISMITENIVVDYEEGELTDELVKDYTGRILKQIKFMTQTIDDFRNFYKPSERKPFGIKNAVQNMLTLLDGHLMQARVKTQILGEEKQIIGAESEFKQVILNIINNAIDAFTTNGIKDKIITISIADDEGMVQLTLQDNAGGIPSELLPDKIFSPFVSTKGDKGTGIGLSLAKMIIEEKMIGHISVSNKAEGAEFLIRVPKA
jgi:PAS domain S-box-containing protein